MKGRMPLAVLAACLVLSGCGDGKNDVKEAESAETAVEFESAEPVKEPIVEPVTSGRNDEELVEEPVVEPVEEPVKEPEGLAEYLEAVEYFAYKRDGGYENIYSFYADDINEDGYPEVFQFCYTDLTASVKKMACGMYTLRHYYNIDLKKEVYTAEILPATDIWHDSLEGIGSPEMVFSYTKGDTKVGLHYQTYYKNCLTTYDHFQEIRNEDLLEIGWADKQEMHLPNGEDKTHFRVAIEYNKRAYKDEEHYEKFVNQYEFETSISLGSGKGWLDMEDALDHLGELP